MSKTSLYDQGFDPILGQQVHEHLVSLGIETPMILSQVQMPLWHKYKKMKTLYTKLLTVMGFDLEDDSLQETPHRLAKMMTSELLTGMDPQNFPRCTTVQNKMKYDEMVIENDITVLSLCEHHLVTIDGKATVAYIPKEKVLGLSKIPRIVDYFCKRGQIQERLTQQIMEALKFILQTDSVAVAIKAKHYCVISRGVKDTSTYTTTSAISGAFCSSAPRQEFLQLI